MKEIIADKLIFETLKRLKLNIRKGTKCIVEKIFDIF